MALGVKAALIELIKAGKAFNQEEAEAAFERIKGRYATDVFE